MPYAQGSIIEVSFDPTLGHEPQKTRLAIVLSDDRQNLMSSLTVVAPITSVNNGYPLHIEIAPDNDVVGYICVEQLRAIDLSARRCEYCGDLDQDTMTSVLEAIGAVFGI